jgi:hypothetical protein
MQPSKSLAETHRLIAETLVQPTASFHPMLR